MYNEFYNFASNEVQLCPYPQWQQYPILYDMEKLYSTSDRALDNEHPGPVCHQQLANKMYEKILLVQQNRLSNYYSTGITKVTVNCDIN